MEFHSCKRAKDGHKSACKDCLNSDKKKYYERNRENILRRQKEYSNNNKQQKKKYYQKNKDKILSKRKKRYCEKKDDVLKIQKKYYSRNKKEILKKRKEYRQNNKEKIAIERKVRREKNVYQYLLWKAKDRAKNKNVVFDITTKDLNQTEVCPILEKQFVFGKGRVQDLSRTIDRLVPEKGYVPGNVLVVSSLANRVKNNGTLSDLQKIITFVEKRLLWFDTFNNSWKNFCVENNITQNEKFAGKKYLIDNARARARAGALPFNIKKEDLFIPSYCPVLGIAIQKNDSRAPSKYSPTIDRLYEKKGYTASNVSVISSKANTMKNNCSLKQLKKIYNNYKKYLS